MGAGGEQVRLPALSGATATPVLRAIPAIDPFDDAFDTMPTSSPSPTAATAPTAKRPNIIFIVADDLGYADLGCYGGREPVSPVLDGLAARGIRFTQGYANSPVCSPTRFAMITARYQYRLRGAAEEPIRSGNRTNTTLGLPTDHPTLPSLLKAAGYRTALVGKCDARSTSSCWRSM
jgi:hypothetical protein